MLKVAQTGAWMRKIADDTPISLTIERALAHAGQLVSQSRQIDSAALLHALADVDKFGEWDRITLPEYSVDLSDPDDGEDAFWLGHSCTATCVRALQLARHIADRYHLYPLPAGLLAIALVADPRSAATRMATTGGMSEEALRRELQDSVLGVELMGLDEVIAEFADPEPSAPARVNSIAVPSTGDAWNVLAYPADTRILLALLGMALLSLTLYVGTLTARAADIGVCVRAVAEAGHAIDIAVGENTIHLDVSCVQKIQRRQGMESLRTLILLFPIYISLRSVGGWWWRRQLRVPDESERAAVTVVQTLAARMGMAQAPSIYIGPDWMRQQARATTLHRRPVLVLGPELAQTARLPGQQHRALNSVLMHELAHVANRDIVAYAYARAMRRGTLAAGTVITVLAFYKWPRADAAIVAVQVLALLLIAELVTRAFLRAREHYADVRAAADDPAALLTMLADDRAVTERRWRWLAVRHPTGSRRRHLVTSPQVLMRLPTWYFFTGGLLSGMMLLTVLPTAQNVLAGTDLARVDAVVAAAVAAVPLGLLLSTGLWRESWYSFTQRRRPPVAIRALVLAAGLTVGALLAPTTFVPSASSALTITALPAALLALSGGFLTCRWLIDVAQVRFSFPKLLAEDQGVRRFRQLRLLVGPLAAIVAAGYLGVAAMWITWAGYFAASERLAGHALTLSGAIVPVLRSLVFNEPFGYTIAATLFLAWATVLAPVPISFRFSLGRVLTWGGGLACIGIVVATVTGPLERPVRIVGVSVNLGWLVIIGIMSMAAMITAACLRPPIRGGFALSVAFRIGCMSLPALVFVPGTGLTFREAILLTLTYGQVASLAAALLGCLVGSALRAGSDNVRTRRERRRQTIATSKREGRRT